MYQKIINTIVQALDSHHIPYMIIGGQAVLIYGEPRLTEDIDITIGCGVDRLKDLLDVINECKFKLPDIDVSDFVQRTMVLPCFTDEDSIRVEFIFSSTGFEAEAMKHTNVVSQKGVLVRYASLEDLIITKIVAGRPRDIEDVVNILRKQPARDDGYIREKLKDLGVALSRSLLADFDKIVRKS